MEITFSISYRARYGETLCIIAADCTLVDWTEQNPLRMQCSGDSFWSVRVTLSDFVDDLSYRYAVLSPSGEYLYETGHLHHLILPADSLHYGVSSADSLRPTLPQGERSLFVRDFWQLDDLDSIFRTRVFRQLFRRPLSDSQTTNTISKNADTNSQNFDTNSQNFGTNSVHSRTTPEPTPSISLLFHIELAQVLPSQGVAVIGSIPELGNWSADSMLLLDDTSYPEWTVQTAIRSAAPFEYKYVLYDRRTHAIVDLEQGDNRRIESLPATGLFVANDCCFRRSHTNFRGSGVVIPIFSLRSEHSFGIGEFCDLHAMADWAAQAGMQMIQTLPVNDTTLSHTNHDSYPYNAISVFALHPIYINIEQMGTLPPDLLKQYRAERTQLNRKSYADYQTVYERKERYFRALYHQDHPALVASADYQRFLADNAYWLDRYALYRAHRDGEDASYYTYLQYHAYRQLERAVNHAHAVGVAVKGDIPIGLAPESVDVEAVPALFNRNASAGAPPDDFSLSGQNWGFPTYNWDEMSKDGYAWWCRRFRQMQTCFDAYRIDHILGFFRIWQMRKTDVWGLCGHFNPALPYTLDELHAMGILLDRERLTEPYIRHEHLLRLFGEQTPTIIRQFFCLKKDGTYRFRKSFDTQVKIQDYFRSRKTKSDAALCEQLIALSCEVLFVADQSHPDLLHPRISISRSYSFACLAPDQQQSLLRLYHDYFYVRHNDFWKASALRKLPTLLHATDMLCCGEDLGMVPACVPEVMQQLHILSLEIQRMPKAMVEFGDLVAVPYLSVCTTGTHDMNPLRAWWQEDAAKTQRYYTECLHRSGTAPAELTPEVAEQILRQHLESPAMWVVLPWQDWVSIDGTLRRRDAQVERINDPADPHNFWCYRMHITLERLLASTDFTDRLRALTSLR